LEILVSREPDMFVGVFAEWKHRVQQWIYKQGELHGLSLNFWEFASGERT
jgi:hypothetical protein